ncbi:trithorax group protein osa-like isoform X2 [Hippocampus comes]|uniref:trithorax group protein osa-like isoform X2 n=1 Tax=Hippocampus comes TaxID=109280 RepID=UPI00094EBDDD|nr:PREDICTED: trithorax group protein osa-like isoform X2 [Hippocampus comes]
MGPGLAAMFSWICLLLFTNAANVPVEHKYHPRPLYKSSAGPALPTEGLRPSLMTLQKQHSKVYSAVQDSDPTPESQSPSSPSTPGSRWALYDQTSSYRPSNPEDQVGMANPGVQRHRSWVLQSSGDRTSTGGLKLDAVKGQPAVNGGGNLLPSWAEYISVYQPPSSYEPPTASLPLSGGVKVSNPQANIGWAAYHPIDVQPSGHKRPASLGQVMETPAAGVPSNWPFNPVYMQSSTYESTAPEVPSGGVKGSLPGKGKEQAQANLVGNLPPSWALFNQVFTSSGYESPTAPESPVTAKEQPAANPGGYLKGWQVYSPVYVQPPSYKPSTSGVNTVKGQQASHPSGTMQKSWTAYGSVEAQPSSSKPATGGLVKGQPASSPGDHLQQEGWSAYSEVYPPTGPVVAPSTGKGQQASQSGGTQQQSWAAYSEVYPPSSFKPPTAPVVPPGPVKGQQTFHPGGLMQKSWTAYGSVEAQPSSSKPATGVLVKDPSASSPGDHLQQSWAAYSEVHPPSIFKPQTAPGGTMQKSWTAYGSVEAQPSSSKPATGVLVKDPSASSPGDHLQQSWAAYSEVYPPSSFKPATPPGPVKGQWASHPRRTMQQNWAAYSKVYPQSSSKPTAPGPVKVQPASHPGGTLQQNWAAYRETYPPTGLVVLPGTVKGQQTSHPGATLEQSWTAYGSVEAQPPSSKPTTGGVVKGQPAPSPSADLHPSWAAYSQVYEPLTAPLVPPGGVKGSSHSIVKGQQASIQSGNLPTGWVDYSPVNVKPATGSVKVNLAKGQSAVNPADSLLPSWALFNPVFTSSGFESPTAPETPVTSKGQPAANPGDNLPKSWAVYSSGHVHPPNYKPSAGGVKQQPVVNTADLLPNWAAYSQVSHPQTSLDIVRGQPAFNPVGTPQQSWAAYSSVEVQPSSSKHETGLRQVDPVKGQRTVNPVASLPPNWAIFNPGYLSSSDSEFPTAPEVPAVPVKVSPLDPGRRQTIVDGNQPQSWILGHPMYEPAASESSVPGKDQPSAKLYGKLHKGWAMYSPVVVRPSTFKPSTGVDTVKRQPVLNAGGNLPPHWTAYSQVYHPPASPVVSPPSTVTGQLASHPGGNLQQSWAVYTSGTGMGQTPGWVKVAAPAGKGQHAFSEANLAHSTGGAKGHTGNGQPAPHPDGNLHQNWAAYSQLNLPSSYKPSGTGNEQPEALPGAKQPATPANKAPSGVGVLVGPSISKGEPAANPGGNQHPKWTSYSSARYWSPGFNPSVAPVPSPVGAHVSLPADAGNWGAGSVSGAKLGSGWAAYGQINNPSSNYKPSRAPGSGHQSSQGAAKQVSGSLSSGGVQVRSQNKFPAHPVGLLANWPYLQVDSNAHATSGLKGYHSAGVPNRSPLKWITSHPGHPGQDLVRFPMETSAPWLSSQVFADELPEEEDDDYDDEELPTSIVRNRNGYQQQRREFSRMHYFQKDEQPYVPYLRNNQRRSPKV